MCKINSGIARRKYRAFEILTEACKNLFLAKIEFHQGLCCVKSGSGKGIGRSDMDKQLLYLNGRPVVIQKAIRVINR